MVQHGYELPRDSTDIVYFNVTFHGDETEYSYPSCCVFLRRPALVPADRGHSLDILQEFQKSLVDVVQHVPARTFHVERHCLSDSDVSDPTALRRVPWHYKLCQDLEHDRLVKKTAAGVPQLKKRNDISKYFIPAGVIGIERDTNIVPGTPAKPMTRTIKLIDSKITAFFPSKRPATVLNDKPIAVNRCRNKITFMVGY